MFSKIQSIKAQEILDSRGNPTVEVELTTKDGVFFASVPSGKSRGKYEALELRDGEKRYQGKGVLKALKNITEIIAPEIIGRDPTQQKEIDELMIELDGTENKEKLGANAILAVSIAVCRAGAAAKNLPLWQYISQCTENISRCIEMPKPCFNLIEGGAHAKNELDFQEFMIVPQWENFKENLQMALEIYHNLKEIIFKKNRRESVEFGDEGGFTPKIKYPKEALELILKALKKNKYQTGINRGYNLGVKIILDVSASQFYSKQGYRMGRRVLSREKLLNYYSNLIKKYPIIALEDPFSQNDWQGFQEITKILGKKIDIFGDDLLASNPQRIKEAKDKKACTGVIIKPNQVGTVTQVIEAAKLAKSYGWKILVSHRSGETLDTFISDFAVGIGADFIKSGAPGPKERMAKYNRLLIIEKEMEKNL